MTNTIEVNGLCKSYGSRAVLHGVSFRVAPNKIVGFLGSNGAGKTTTIRILLGLIQSTAGRATIFGRPCRIDTAQFRQDVGYLPGEVRFYPWMTGRATLRFLANARGIDCGEQINRLTKVFDLDTQKIIRKYSSGMKQKLGLIQALMHRPRLLVLDEPTNGLDPLMRQALLRELRVFAAEGRSVLFSSHTLSEVEELCDHVIVLREGRILADQTITEIRRHTVRRVELTFVDKTDISKTIPAHGRLLSSTETTAALAWTGPMVELVAWLSTLSFTDVSIAKPSLEDLFMAYYSDKADT